MGPQKGELTLPTGERRRAQFRAKRPHRREFPRGLVTLPARGIEEDRRQQTVMLEFADETRQPSGCPPIGWQMAQRIRWNQPPACVGQDVPQRHRPHPLNDHLRPLSPHLGQPAGDNLGVGKGRRQQKETAASRCQEENLLPRRASLAVGEVVCLVQHDQLRGEPVAIQGVAQDLGGRDDHRRLGVDAALAGEQPDRLRAVQPREPVKLLVGKRL